MMVGPRGERIIFKRDVFGTPRLRDRGMRSRTMQEDYPQLSFEVKLDVLRCLVFHLLDTRLIR